MAKKTIEDLMNLKKGMYIVYYKKKMIYAFEVIIDDPTGYSVPIQAINTALVTDPLYRWDIIVEVCPNILKSKFIRYKRHK